MYKFHKFCYATRKLNSLKIRVNSATVKSLLLHADKTGIVVRSKSKALGFIQVGIFTADDSAKALF